MGRGQILCLNSGKTLKQKSLNQMSCWQVVQFNFYNNKKRLILCGKKIIKGYLKQEVKQIDAFYTTLQPRQNHLSYQLMQIVNMFFTFAPHI